MDRRTESAQSVRVAALLLCSAGMRENSTRYDKQRMSNQEEIAAERKSLRQRHRERPKKHNGKTRPVLRLVLRSWKRSGKPTANKYDAEEKTRSLLFLSLPKRRKHGSRRMDTNHGILRAQPSQILSSLTVRYPWFAICNSV